MRTPRKVFDVELSRPVVDVDELEGYYGAHVIARLHGIPIGALSVPIVDGRCTAASILTAVHEQLGTAVVRHLLADAMAQADSRPALAIQSLASVAHRTWTGPWPTLTVAVCSRDRPEALARCLESIEALEYPDLDLLVVDNAPSGPTTQKLVAARFPRIRYVHEPRPGLDWARNRAINEAAGEILAYTDDDVVVDARWACELAAVFAENPDVMAVTGLVVPYELETEAQLLFERHGGFGRGFERQWHRVDLKGGELAARHHSGAGAFGTGANMAFRRRVFDEIGRFDPALDVGTATNGGGDLDMFFRVLKAGHTLVYEPAAMVRHCHRRDLARLREQVRANGTGFYSFLVRSGVAFPEERPGLLRMSLWWMWHGMLRQLLLTGLRPSAWRRRLVTDQLMGSVSGLTCYRKARAGARAIESRFGPLPDLPIEAVQLPPPATERRCGTAVRCVHLSRRMEPLADLDGFSTVRVYVEGDNGIVGAVTLANYGPVMSSARLIQGIVAGLAPELVQQCGEPSTRAPSHREATSAVLRALCGEPVGSASTRTLPGEVAVSIVVATFDRPELLGQCLGDLEQQQTDRVVEIIVVDNHPSSGLTPPVVADFPAVKLVPEARQGLAYARNAGLLVATGSIVASTDDDVRLPPYWLERLLSPFCDPEVMVVTGNILPLEMDRPAARLFERYGGLGRGFEPRRFDSCWFDSCIGAVPTWSIGATANAAFRREIFDDPRIGLLEEALGPGTPTGVGEDTYAFYKVLKAGYAIAYHPAAHVWHRHRREMDALRHQLYNYSKGHVAYHLTTLFNDRDLRAVLRLAVVLPAWRCRQIARGLLRRTDYPLRLVMTEIAGNAAGPWVLWRSRRRVRRERRSRQEPSETEAARW
ncbi:MAG: glycosyltransferase family 2 protein [Acidimicrobiales bacterium]